MQRADSRLLRAGLAAACPVKTEVSECVQDMSLLDPSPRFTRHTPPSKALISPAAKRYFTSTPLSLTSSSSASKPTPVLCPSAHTSEPMPRPRLGFCRCRQLIPDCSLDIGLRAGAGHPAERERCWGDQSESLRHSRRVIPHVLCHLHKHQMLGSREGQRSHLFRNTSLTTSLPCLNPFGNALRCHWDRTVTLGRGLRTLPPSPPHRNPLPELPAPQIHTHTSPPQASAH